MPDNKLVIRRLPPSMSEDEFLKQVSPLPDHDYFYFYEANPGLGPHSFSRAYINFLDTNDMSVFRERFDNYVFLDKDGHEYPAVVEQSLWQKSPKNGPFYKKITPPIISSKHSPKDDDQLENKSIQQVETSLTDISKMPCPSEIESDPDFLSFIERLSAQKKRPQHSPIQTLETNLDELTNHASAACSGSKDNSKVITPLIGYVNQQRTMKGSKKVVK